VPDWLRRAGQGRADDGSIVTWTLAEGRRGRRWREVVATGEGIRSSLLLELDPEGRFSHLELSTAAGLLTLHPEGDGTLHGNAVVAGGVRHVVGLPWDADDAILLEGSSVCLAAVSPDRPPAAALWIGLDLELRREPLTAGPRAVADDGLPRLAEARSWPLEGDA
jgi:hypothetical protein